MFLNTIIIYSNAKQPLVMLLTICTTTPTYINSAAIASTSDN